MRKLSPPTLAAKQQHTPLNKDVDNLLKGRSRERPRRRRCRRPCPPRPDRPRAWGSGAGRRRRGPSAPARG